MLVVTLPIGLVFGLVAGVFVVLRWRVRMAFAGLLLASVLLLFFNLPLGIDARVGLMTGTFLGFVVSLPPSSADGSASSETVEEDHAGPRRDQREEMP